MRIRLALFAWLVAAGWSSAGAVPAEKEEVANCKTVDKCLEAIDAMAQPVDAVQTEQDRWAAPAPPWEGVWQGTIGNLPVHVCLDTTPYDKKGAYYYDRVKKLLRLEPAVDDDSWFEQEIYGKNGARWRLSVADGALGGTWNDGNKELLVRLNRIGGPSKEYDGPCGSMEFIRPRLEQSSLTSLPKIKDGAAYTKWTFEPGPWLGDQVEISTFTLNRPGAGIAKVNQLLKAVLPAPDATGEWVECVAGNMNSSSMDGTYYKSIEPTLISGRWLAAMEHGEYYCGGAHPDNVNIPHTFDLSAGVEVDPLDWFLPTAVHREELEEYGPYKTLTADFVAMILKDWRASGNEHDDECRDSTLTQESWSVGITRGALVFSPNFPRVIMACGDDYKVPFAKLQPWLNVEGKAIVARLPR